MKRGIALAACALAAVCAAPAVCAEYGLMAATCVDPEAQQFDVMCGPVWLPDADRRLENAYRKLLERLGKEESRRLEESQRAWIRYRDADVAAVVRHYDQQGAAIEAIASSHAFRLTRERLRYLEQRLAGFDRW